MPQAGAARPPFCGRAMAFAFLPRLGGGGVSREGRELGGPRAQRRAGIGAGWGGVRPPARHWPGAGAGPWRTAAAAAVLSHRAGPDAPVPAAAPCTHSHERLPRLHREAEPGRQGEGCGEVLQGLRPHPRHRPEEGLRIRGKGAASPFPTPLVLTRV